MAKVANKQGAAKPAAPKAEGKEARAILVVTSKQPSRRRAGIAFGPTPTRLFLDELGEERAAAIEADPVLDVERAIEGKDDK